MLARNSTQPQIPMEKSIMTIGMKANLAVTLPWFGTLKLPATPRELWLWLAAVVVINHLVLAYRMQSIDFVVLAALTWGGALLCIEDKLPELTPEPSQLSLVLGSLLLVAGLWRSSQVFHPEPVIHLLALTQAYACSIAEVMATKNGVTSWGAISCPRRLGTKEPYHSRMMRSPKPVVKISESDCRT